MGEPVAKEPIDLRYTQNSEKWAIFEVSPCKKVKSYRIHM